MNGLSLRPLSSRASTLIETLAAAIITLLVIISCLQASFLNHREREGNNIPVLAAHGAVAQILTDLTVSPPFHVSPGGHLLVQDDCIILPEPSLQPSDLFENLNVPPQMSGWVKWSFSREKGLIRTHTFAAMEELEKGNSTVYPAIEGFRVTAYDEKGRRVTGSLNKKPAKVVISYLCSGSLCVRTWRPDIEIF